MCTKSLSMRFAADQAIVHIGRPPYILAVLPFNSQLDLPEMTKREPFFPTDKPKSWTMSVSAGLAGLLFGFIAYVAVWFQVPILRNAAMVLFAICWIVGAVTGVIFAIGLMSGRYSNLQSKQWQDQVW